MNKTSSLALSTALPFYVETFEGETLQAQQAPAAADLSRASSSSTPMESDSRGSPHMALATEAFLLKAMAARSCLEDDDASLSGGLDRRDSSQSLQHESQLAQLTAAWREDVREKLLLKQKVAAGEIALQEARQQGQAMQERLMQQAEVAKLRMRIAEEGELAAVGKLKNAQTRVAELSTALMKAKREVMMLTEEKANVSKDLSKANATIARLTLGDIDCEQSPVAVSAKPHLTFFNSVYSANTPQNSLAHQDQAVLYEAEARYFATNKPGGFGNLLSKLSNGSTTRKSLEQLVPLDSAEEHNFLAGFHEGSTAVTLKCMDSMPSSMASHSGASSMGGISDKSDGMSKVSKGWGKSTLDSNHPNHLNHPNHHMGGITLGSLADGSEFGCHHSVAREITESDVRWWLPRCMRTTC